MITVAGASPLEPEDPNVLVRLHVQTLFTLDSGGDLVGVTGRGVSDAPRFFLGSTAEGRQSWVRADLGPDLRRDLATLVSAVPGGFTPGPDPRLVVPFRERLEKQEPVRRTWVGPAYRFPDDLIRSDGTVRITAENAALLEPYLAEWVEDVREGNPLVAYVEEGKAVSLCGSVATSDRVHEAGVETHPDFRGRGLAAKVVAGWAREVRELGRVPLYSTCWENRASRSVARGSTFLYPNGFRCFQRLRTNTSQKFLALTISACSKSW